MKMLLANIRLTFVLLILCSGVYTLAVWGVAQLAFHSSAEGSLIAPNGKIIGSRLVGQQFQSPKYFQGRFSAVGYNAAGSGGSNQSCTNPDLLNRFADAVSSATLLGDAISTSTIAFDRITASGSGLDPDITPANAMQQIDRIAKARGMSSDDLHALVESHIEKPLLGCLGPPKVNVLMLNIALDQMGTGK